MSNQQLPTTDQQRDLGIIITKTISDKNKQKDAANHPTENWALMPAISDTETKNRSSNYSKL